MTMIFQDIVLYQKQDKIITVPIKDSAGNNKVMTGATVTYVIKARKDSAVALVTKTVGSGIVIGTTPNDHVLTITLGDTDTDNLAPGIYWHMAEGSLGTDLEPLFEGYVICRMRGVLP